MPTQQFRQAAFPFADILGTTEPSTAAKSPEAMLGSTATAN